MIENYQIKTRVFNAKHGPRNRDEENDLGYKILVEKEKIDKELLTQKLKKEFVALLNKSRF